MSPAYTYYRKGFPMRNRNKIDPAVAAIQKAVANKPNSVGINYSLTVGQRVITEYTVVPKTGAEYLRIKSDRGHEEGVPAITAEIINDSETGCFGSISLDGKILCYSIAQFGRAIDYAWLRKDGRPVLQVYSKEGLETLISGI